MTLNASSISPNCSAINSITIFDYQTEQPCEAYFWGTPETRNSFRFNTLEYITYDYAIWDFGDGTKEVVYMNSNDIGSEIKHQYSGKGYFEVKLTVYKGLCSDEYKYLVEVEEGICDSVSFDYTLNKGTINLTNTSPYMDLPSKHWTWTFNDVDVVNKKDNISHTFEYEGYQSVQLDMVDTEEGCKSTYWEYVYVIDSTQTTAMFDTVSTGPLTIQVYNKSLNTDKLYWDFGDGTTSTDPDVEHTYAEPGYYYICLTASNNLGNNYNQYCMYVEVGIIDCKADFSMQINNATSDVVFTNKSTPLNSSSEFYWDFGDWNYDYSSSSKVIHNYTEPGNYNVCLSAYNNFCYDYKCQEVMVLSTDTTVIKADFEYMVVDATKTLLLSSRSSRNATDFYWTFGDGSFKSGKEVSNTYSIPGNYEVCLKAFNKTTQKSDRKCENISVGTLECKQEADFTQLINGKSVKFSDKSTGKVAYRFWDFGDGESSTAENPKHTYTEPGFYVVSLAISDTLRTCTDMKIDVIKVGEAECKAGFAATVDPTSRKVTFANKSIGKIRNYYWSFGDFDFSVLKQPILHTYPKEGMYNVSLTVLDSSGLCMDYYEENIQVGTVDCNAKFEYMIDSAQYRAFFKSKVLGQFTYTLWSMGDGKISTDQNPIHKYKAPGYYTVGLSAYNPLNGCMDYYEDVILVGSQDVDCEAEFVYQTAGKRVKFKDKSKGNIVSYNWNFGDGQSIATTKDTVGHFYTKPGFYNVCLKVVNQAGISNLTCDYIAIAPEETEICKADFNFTVDNATKKVSFKDASIGKAITKYYWDYGNKKSDSTILGKSAQTYADANYYLVSLKIKTATGCNSKTYKLVNVAKADSVLKSGFGYDIGKSNQKAGGYPVDFIGTGIGDHAKLRWDFGDGSASDSTTLTPYHNFEPGKYNVCLTISDPVTNQSSTTCDSITIDCRVTAMPTPKCKDTIITLPESGTITITPAAINNNSTVDCSKTPTIKIDKSTFTKADVGEHTVTLTVTDAANNSSTCTAKVTIIESPESPVISGIKEVLISGINCRPNPFANDHIAIDYAISKPAKVTVELYDMSNRLVSQLVNSSLLAGKQTVYFDGKKLSSGSYLLLLKTSDGNMYRKIIMKQ